MAVFFASASGLTCYFGSRILPVKTTKTSEASLKAQPPILIVLATALPLTMVVTVALNPTELGYVEAAFLWSYYFEPFCLIPQIIMHQRYHNTNGGMGTFILFMGIYRLLYMPETVILTNIFDSMFKLSSGIQAVLAVGGVLYPYRVNVSRFCRDAFAFVAPRCPAISIGLLLMCGTLLFPNFFLEVGSMSSLVILGFYFRHMFFLSRHNRSGNNEQEESEESSESLVVQPDGSSELQADGEASVLDEAPVSEETPTKEEQTTEDEGGEHDAQEEEDEEPKQEFMSDRELKILACIFFSCVAIVIVCLIGGSALLENEGLRVLVIPLLIAVVWLFYTYGRYDGQDQCLPNLIQWFRHPFWVLVLLSMIFATVDETFDFPPGAFISMLIFLFSPFTFLAYFLCSTAESSTMVNCCMSIAECLTQTAAGEKPEQTVEGMNVPLLSDIHLEEAPHKECERLPVIEVV